MSSTLFLEDVSWSWFKGYFLEVKVHRFPMLPRDGPQEATDWSDVDSHDALHVVAVFLAAERGKYLLDTGLQ